MFSPMTWESLIFSFLLGFGSMAVAVPAHPSQNGRLLDANGAAVTGTHALTFRLYGAETGGNALWEDVVVTDFNNGLKG